MQPTPLSCHAVALSPSADVLALGVDDGSFTARKIASTTVVYVYCSVMRMKEVERWEKLIWPFRAERTHVDFVRCLAWSTAENGASLLLVGHWDNDEERQLELVDLAK